MRGSPELDDISVSKLTPNSLYTPSLSIEYFTKYSTMDPSIFPRSSPSDPIYLDYNATTPVDPEVAKAMWPFMTKYFGNPSSSHIYGRCRREYSRINPSGEGGRRGGPWPHRADDQREAVRDFVPFRW